MNSSRENSPPADAKHMQNGHPHPTSEKQSSAASHTFDRAAKKWDSFDVEAALAQLADDDDHKAHAHSSRTTAPVAQQVNIHLCLQLDKGVLWACQVASYPHDMMSY